MDKYITDERTGIVYTLVGDYYLPFYEEEQTEPLGRWGQRHRKYLMEQEKDVYTGMLLGGRLNDYLHRIDRQAEEMYFRLVWQYAEKEGITEQLKAADQIAWVGAMNNIHARVTEIINRELVFA